MLVAAFSLALSSSDEWARTNALGSVIAAVASLAAFIMAWWAWRASKKEVRHRALYELQKEYRTPEMHAAVSALWKLYDTYPRSFTKRLRIARDRKPFERLSAEERFYSMDGQRRLVSHFFTQLGVLVEAGEVPRNVIFRLWEPDNIRIVDLVLIPLEETVAQEHPGRRTWPRIKRDHPLRILYEASQDYPGRWRQCIANALWRIGCPFKWSWYGGEVQSRRARI